jgi:hypothetical protein
LLKASADAGLGKILVVANGVAILLVFLVMVAAGAFGAFFYGIPIVIAANVYALAGWRWIVRPDRSTAMPECGPAVSSR